MTTGSRLGRLFTYSKDSLVTAQENFTTEAVRMAIEDDARPIVAVITSLAPIWAEENGLARLRTVPKTQVELPPRGWLDLVIELVDERADVRAEVWVEVKIGAPESGRQLDFYEQERQTRGHPVLLVTLANEPIRRSVSNIFWSQLYQKARRGAADTRSWREHPKWRDLCLFLEEQGVTNDGYGPVTDVEAASIGPAYQLINKVSEVVKAVHSRVPEILPGVSSWSNNGQLLNFVGAWFRQSGDMIGQNGSIGYGLTTEEGTAYWKVEVDAIRGGSTQRDSEAARKLALAAVPTLGEDWTAPPTGNAILVSRIRAGMLDTHDAVVAWMEARLRELAASGVLASLARTPPGAPARELSAVADTDAEPPALTL